MKIHLITRIIFGVCTLVFLNVANAAGLIQPKNSTLPELDIREHHVDVVIEDGYVTTSIEQVFHNPNNQDLEAIYSFPVPEGAAVGEFIYWVDGQAVVGEVMEKKQARQLYNEEKAAGRNTALVEKDEYRTFDISVYPVRAMADVKIKLVYIQAAHIDTNVGRYVYPLEDGGVDEEKNAFWSRNEVVKESFSFNLSFRSSYPIDAIRLPRQPGATIKQIGEHEWSVALVNDAFTNESEQAEIISLSEDILVYWRHKDGLPGSLDMVSYKPEPKGKGTFMLTLTPGDDLGPTHQGSDWVFVLDVSGSMQGKYAALAEGVRQGMNKLRTNDRFKVVVFNDSATDLSQGFKLATPENIEQILRVVESYQVGGGTNLYSGIQRGLHNADADRPLALLLVTDGVANVGVTEKKQFLELLEQHDIRLFTFIMGNSANRPLLNEMTKISKGFSLSVSNSDDIVGQILLATSKLTHNAFTDVHLKINGVKVKNLSQEDIGTLYRGEQLNLFGHYWGDGAADVELTAKVAGEQKVYRTRVDFPEIATRNPELERLWAYATIENLQSKIDYLGEDADAKQAITDIALEYSLVTDYTSMIVLEDEVFEAMKIDRKNKRRVETEHDARAKRKVQAVKDNRADTQQPMFSSNRSSSGGGGAVGLSGILLLMVLSIFSYLFRLKSRAV